MTRPCEEEKDKWQAVLTPQVLLLALLVTLLNRSTSETAPQKHSSYVVFSGDFQICQGFIFSILPMNRFGRTTANHILLHNEESALSTITAEPTTGWSKDNVCRERRDKEDRERKRVGWKVERGCCQGNNRMPQRPS